MVDRRFFCGGRVAVLLLVLAGSSLLPHRLIAQTIAAPAQGGAVSNVQLPADVLAQLDKLRNDLKAAQAAGDAKAEAKTLNQIGELYFRTSDYPKALESYNQALVPARSSKDAYQEAAALNGIAHCYRSQGQNQKAMDIFRQALGLAAAGGGRTGSSNRAERHRLG